MFPDFYNTRIGCKKATEVITDENWLKETFVPTVGQRGKAIIDARGASSAASAANAVDTCAILSTRPVAISTVSVSFQMASTALPPGLSPLPIKVDAVGKAWSRHQADRPCQGKDPGLQRRVAGRAQARLRPARPEHLVLHPQSLQGRRPGFGAPVFVGAASCACPLRVTLSGYTGFQPVYPRFVASIRALHLLSRFIVALVGQGPHQLRFAA